MQRRKFILSSGVMLAAGGLAMAGCTTTGQDAANSTAGNSDKRAAINHDVDATLSRLYTTVPGSRELVAKARGVLVFPQVVQAGFVVGAQYGQGALRIGGRTEGFYSTAAGSFGLQAGAQSKAIVFCLMNEQALSDFRSRNGWAVGGDATVAVVKVGANGNIDSSTATAPVEAFVLTNAGLMAGVSLEGTKVSRLDI